MQPEQGSLSPGIKTLASSKPLDSCNMWRTTLVVGVCCWWLFSWAGGAEDTMVDMEDMERAKNASWSWEWTEKNEIPCHAGMWYSGALWSGTGPDNEPILLGRAHYFGHVVPAVVQDRNSSHPAVFSFRGQVLSATTYEMLCGVGVSWRIIQNANANTTLPSSALPVGSLDDGTVLYACLASAYRGASIGMVDPETNYCKFPTSMPLSGVYDYEDTRAGYYLLIKA